MVSLIPGRVAWTVALLALLSGAGGAHAQCSEGTTLGYGCGDYTAEGCCSGGNVLYWCENGYTCRLSCNSDPSCGWNQYVSAYKCGTAGLYAPNNSPPYDCDDADGDTYTPPSDCDDTDPFINPDAVEHCDGIDNDCDGHADNGFDGDGDGYPNGDDPDCQQYLPQEMWDCDDSHASANPGAEDIPYDDVDQDCDGSDLTDVDGDGHDGGPGDPDCNDNNPDIHPAAGEDCTDGFDNNCDGLTDTADPLCGGDDDDETGDDDTPGDDDVTGDDDTTQQPPDDDDVSAEPGPGEPLGFGCACATAAAPRVGLAAGGLMALLLVGSLARRRR